MDLIDFKELINKCIEYKHIQIDERNATEKNFYHY